MIFEDTCLNYQNHNTIQTWEKCLTIVTAKKTHLIRWHNTEFMHVHIYIYRENKTALNTNWRNSIPTQVSLLWIINIMRAIGKSSFFGIEMRVK